jgi:hypothetical protein
MRQAKQIKPQPGDGLRDISDPEIHSAAKAA